MTKDSSIIDCVKKKSIVSSISTPITSPINQISLTNNKNNDEVFSNELGLSQSDNLSQSTFAIESSSSEKFLPPNVLTKEETSQITDQNSKNIKPLLNENDVVLSRTHLKDSVYQENCRKMFSPENEQPKLPHNTPDLDYNKFKPFHEEVCFFNCKLIATFG